MMLVFPSLYVRTDPYGPYGTRRIHLRVLAPMWPKYTRTPIDCPYPSDRKRVISYGLPIKREYWPSDPFHFNCSLYTCTCSHFSRPASFLFLSFSNTRCRCASTKRYDNLKSGEDKTLSKIIFLVVSVWLFLERSCPHQNTIIKYTTEKNSLATPVCFPIY